ncbi:MAG: hypothetical protein ACON4R_00375 [Akkermansiaceae bacterium]
MSKHMLLTSADGYLGMRLLSTLLEAGHRVTVSKVSLRADFDNKRQVSLLSARKEKPE